MYAEKKKNGKWTARYRDEHGKLRTAGTFTTKDAALKAAKQAKDSAQQPDEGSQHKQMSLHDYFYDVWLKEPHVTKRTQTNYESCFRIHIDPFIGAIPVLDVTTKDVRAIVKGHLPDRLQLAHRIKAVLGSVYRTLVEEEELERNPAQGIRLKAPAPKSFTPLTPDEFRLIVAELPDEANKFFARFLVGSGLRYGEAAALRVNDFDPTTSEMYVRRRISTVGRAVSASQSRYQVLDATKSGQYRVVPLSTALTDELMEHVDRYDLKGDDLIFPRKVMFQPATPPDPVLGGVWKVGNRTFVHGTLYSFVMGKCRCDDCVLANNAYRRKYKASKRQKDEPAYQEVFMSWELWNSTWKRAIKSAGLTWSPRTHDLRHANATILVASGVDIFEVQQRLGHANLKTTMGYLHRVQAMKSRAAEATDVFLNDKDQGPQKDDGKK